MMVFFTHVFAGRHTLQEKSTYIVLVSKNPIISQILGNKINIFTGHQSKIKNRSCFLPVLFDLELMPYLKSVSARSFGACLATCTIQSAHFDAKVEGAHRLRDVSN